MKDAIMNSHVHMFECTCDYISLGLFSRSGNIGACSQFMFNLTKQLLSNCPKLVEPFYIPMSSVGESHSFSMCFL